MLPAYIVALINEQIETDLIAHVDELPKLQTSAAERVSLLGHQNFGGAVIMALLPSAGKQAESIVFSIRKVLGEIRIIPYDGLVDDLLKIFDLFISIQIKIIRDRIDKYHGKACNQMISEGNDITSTIEKACRVHRMALKRFGFSLADPANTTIMNSITITHSTFGSLQVGENNSLSGVVNLSESSRSELAKALDEIKSHLSDSPSQDGAEIIELVEDTKAEVAKSTPNRHRIRSLLVGISAGIKNISSLGGAYKVISGVAEYFGFKIPD